MIFALFVIGLIGFGVLCALNVLILAYVNRLTLEQRDRFDAFLGYAELGIRNYADLDSKVQSALDCLVTADAKLDATMTPEETRINAA